MLTRRDRHLVAASLLHIDATDPTSARREGGPLNRRSFLAGLMAAGAVGIVARSAGDTDAGDDTAPAPLDPTPTGATPTPTNDAAVGSRPTAPAGPLVCPVPAEDRDTTGEIAAWIAGLPDGAEVTFAASQGRVYRIDRSLAVTGKRGLTITDAAFRIGAPSTELDSAGRSTRRHLWFTSCTDLVIDRVSVQGQNTTGDDGAAIDVTGQARYDALREWEHALAVEDCQRVRVTGLRADAVFGDGVYWRRVADGRLDDFSVSRNGRQGVAAVAANGLVISNGTIVNSRRSGIDLEPNTASEVIEHVEIADMEIGSRLIPVNATGPGTVRDVHVHDVVVTSGSVPSLSLVSGSGGRRDGWTVERWTSTGVLGSPLAVIRAFDASDLVVRDFSATCDPDRAMTGIELVRPGVVRLQRCTFEGAARLVTSFDPVADASLTVVSCVPEA